MDSEMFTIDHTEELDVNDLRLVNKEKLEAPAPNNQRIYVGSLEEIKKPFSEQIKPYLEAFLAGAATTAGYAGSYGMKALSALGGALWWGFTGIKELFNKTSEYMKPKFVLVTSKDEMKNENNMKTVEKIKQDVAVLGLDEYKQLVPIQNGKFQVAIPMDQDFINYLRKEKIEVKKVEWEPNLEPTKTMIVPSESFSVVFEELKENNIPVKVNNYGGFCTFDFEGKNQIEYECINKLKLDNKHIEGYLLPMPQKVESIKSQKSDPSAENQSLIATDVKEVKDITEKSNEEIKVKSVQGVQLIQQYQLSSDEIKLEFA